MDNSVLEASPREDLKRVDSSTSSSSLVDLPGDDLGVQAAFDNAPEHWEDWPEEEFGSLTKKERIRRDSGVTIGLSGKEIPKKFMAMKMYPAAADFFVVVEAYQPTTFTPLPEKFELEVAVESVAGESTVVESADGESVDSETTVAENETFTPATFTKYGGSSAMYPCSTLNNDYYQIVNSTFEARNSKTTYSGLNQSHIDVYNFASEAFAEGLPSQEHKEGSEPMDMDTACYVLGLEEKVWVSAEEIKEQYVRLKNDIYARNTMYGMWLNLEGKLRLQNVEKAYGVLSGAECGWVIWGDDIDEDEEGRVAQDVQDASGSVKLPACLGCKRLKMRCCRGIGESICRRCTLMNRECVPQEQKTRKPRKVSPKIAATVDGPVKKVAAKQKKSVVAEDAEMGGTGAKVSAPGKQREASGDETTSKNEELSLLGINDNTTEEDANTSQRLTDSASDKGSTEEDSQKKKPRKVTPSSKSTKSPKSKLDDDGHRKRETEELSNSMGSLVITSPGRKTGGKAKTSTEQKPRGVKRKTSPNDENEAIVDLAILTVADGSTKPPTKRAKKATPEKSSTDAKKPSTKKSTPEKAATVTKKPSPIKSTPEKPSAAIKKPRAKKSTPEKSFPDTKKPSVKQPSPSQPLPTGSKNEVVSSGIAGGKRARDIDDNNEGSENKRARMDHDAVMGDGDVVYEDIEIPGSSQSQESYDSGVVVKIGRDPA